MELKEIQKTRQHIYKGMVFDLYHDTVTLPDGNEAGRDCVYHNGGAAVVALTNEDDILFVKQFRYVCGEETLELPAGKLDSKDEDPTKAAIRELKEETGAVAKHFVKIGECYSTPGFCNERIHLYFAKELSFGEQQLDEEEFLNVVKIPKDDAVRMAKEGKFKDLKTLAGILYFAAFENGEQ